MKRPFRILAICVGAVVLSAGCSKTDDPPMPKVVQNMPGSQVTPPQVNLATPTLPTAPLPDPVVPKGADIPAPQPGQANDHSSPAFKDGGKPDPSK